MLAIPKMKALMGSPSFSTLSPRLFKTNSHLLLPCTSESTLCNHQCNQGLNIPALNSLSKTSICSIQNRTMQIGASRIPPSGEIHVIVGPMFAGKTTTLLRRIESESNNGRSIAIIKSNKDTRYALDSIVTHDGLKLPCWPLTTLSSFKHKIGPDGYKQLDVIGIDEAQFFEDLYDFCREAADNDGKTVIVAGLDGDYLRRSFGSVLDIIPLADTVTKLTARCEFCGKQAFFTLRKTDEKQTELIGGADKYMPVCRNHYVSGQVVIEAARIVVQSTKVQCESVS